MALFWRAVSAFLTLEIGVLLLLCAPLPWGVRKTMSRWIFQANALKRLNMMLKFIFFGLTLSLLESISALRSARERAQAPLSSAMDDMHSGHTRDEKRWLEARAERNFYVAGFAIVVMIAIMRLVKLASIEILLRYKIKHYNGNKPITETGETIPNEIPKIK